MKCFDCSKNYANGGTCERWPDFVPCPNFQQQGVMRIKELESQLAFMTKKAETAENERDRLARCLAQIQILIAKYRIPEEGE